MLRRTLVTRSALSHAQLIALSVTAILPQIAFAGPQLNSVASGVASIAGQGGDTHIVQQSDRAIIDWHSFDVNAHESVRFSQPSANSVTVNRIQDSKASLINGSLTANGRLVMINPNGIVFGNQARVDVSGLIATTSGLDEQRFKNSGELHFNTPGRADASVVNHGQITARDAGLVGLVAPTVENSGVISARLGKVSLASGDLFTVDLYGNQLYGIALSDNARHQLIRQTGSISAEGGEITLTAVAGRQLVDRLVEVSGELKAPSVTTGEGGRIILRADKGGSMAGTIVTNNAKLDVSSSAGKGGQVLVTADRVGIKSGSTIDARGAQGGGTVRVGGEYLGQGITPTALRTIVEADTVIDASATSQGNGGEVIVWADEWTRFYGQILARGSGWGSLGGDVETSGKQQLIALGSVDVSSPDGKAGTWLLDPADLTISSAATNNINTLSDTPSVGTTTFDQNVDTTASVVNVSAITSNLDAGTHVIIQTDTTGAGTGNITLSNALTSTGNGNLTMSAFGSIFIDQAIMLQGGALTLRSNNAGAADGSTGTGMIRIGAAISTNGGNITMGGGTGAITPGNGYAVGLVTGSTTTNKGVRIAATVDAGGGNVVINGRGGLNTQNQNNGVHFTGAGAAVTTSGNGNITINGRAGGITNSTSNVGVAVYNSGAITAQHGTITLNGTGGGAGTGDFNEGVLIRDINTLVSVTGSGAIVVTGQGGNGAGTGPNNNGIWISDNAIVSAPGGGSITLTGTGSNSSGGGSRGVNISVSGAVVGSGGAIQINGTGGNGIGDSQIGINISGQSSRVTNTGLGTITLNGVARGTTNSATNQGIRISSSGRVSAVNGLITLNGTGGGAGTGGSNAGIVVIGLNSLVTTLGNGGILIAARGGNDSGSSTGNDGLNVNSTGVISSTGGGTITINATGSNASGVFNRGVLVQTSGHITSDSGAIYVNGTGGLGTGGNNYGVSITGVSSRITGTGNAAVMIDGHGGGSGNGGSNQGVRLDTSGTVSTVSGLLQVTGRGGGTGTGTGNDGVNISTSSSLSSSGGGAITVSGTGSNASGGSNRGVYLFNSGSITGSGAAIQVTGFGGASEGDNNIGILLSDSSTQITNTGAGSITLNGTAGGVTNSSNNRGIQLASSAVVSTFNGLLRLFGRGGGEGTGNDNDGVLITGLNTSLSATGSGTIEVNGRGGNDAGTTGNNEGIQIGSSATIQTLGGGAITLRGTGSNSSGVAGSRGVFIVNSGAVLGSGGAIDITGTGGADGTTTGSHGIAVSGLSSRITNTGIGTITLIGTGGGAVGSTLNNGINIAAAGAVSTVNGLLSLAGVGGANSAGVRLLNASSQLSTSGSGNLQVTGTAGSGSTSAIAIDTSNSLLAGAGRIITLSGGTGDVSFGDISIPVTQDFAANFTVTGGNILGTGVWGGVIRLGNVSLVADQAVTLPSIQASSIFTQAHNGSLYLNGDLDASATSGAAITLVVWDDFVNGANYMLSNGLGARWLIYSDFPTENTLGASLQSDVNFYEYSCVFGGTCGSLPATGNGVLYRRAIPSSGGGTPSPQPNGLDLPNTVWMVINHPAGTPVLQNIRMLAVAAQASGAKVDSGNNADSMKDTPVKNLDRTYVKAMHGLVRIHPALMRIFGLYKQYRL